MRGAIATAAALVATGALGGAAAPAASADAPPLAPPRVVAVADVPQLVEAPPQPELQEDRLVQLGVPDPATFAPPTPERALAELLDAWHDRAWGRMALWSPSTARELRARHAAERLRGWAIVDRRRAGDAVVFTVLTSVRGMRPALRRERATLLARRDPGGRWRVEEGLTILPVPPATPTP